MGLITFSNLVVGSVTCVVLLCIAQIIYNTRYHPLRRIPGPALAAASSWYEVYFDLFKRESGQYFHEIDRQHEIYGPIIRINPREVHIKDVNFRDSLYSRNRRVDKDPRYVGMFGLTLSLFGTENHEIHRVRRSALNPFFSKASIVRLEPIFHTYMRSVCDTLSSAGKKGSVIELRNAMIAVTLDIISDYTFGDPVGAAISLESWPKWEAMMSGIAEGVPLAKSFPGLAQFLLKMPPSVIKNLSRVAGDYLDYVYMIRRKVQVTIGTHGLNVSQAREIQNDSKYSSVCTGGKPNIYTEVLDSTLPAIEKSEQRLTQEGVGFISAGAETTAVTTATIIFHVIQQPDTLQKIRQELQTVMPTRYTNAKWTQLEQLPMMSAVVKEGLRISVSICGRLPVVLDEGLNYQGHIIPPRTSVSMSPRHALMDPEIFVEPTKFEPMRWIKASSTHRASMDKAFVPFNQGPRMCIGLNLAYANIYHSLSCMLARFEFELVDTLRERDVDLCRDCFVSKPRRESKGIRVRIVEEFREQW